ncbi:MAG: DNA-3-methyladenine glycosylase [Gammaproteobacteria bacterium]
MRQLTPELHDDFHRAARRLSAPLARAIRDIGPIGFQRRRTRDLGVHLARVIVGQQLSTLAARAIWARVEAAAQTPRVLDFCSTDNLEALRACGLSGNKARALIALRGADAAGELDAQQLRRLPATARREALTRLWGIGPWTADMVSMFFFREADVWPLGDLAVRKTFERFVEGHRRYDVHSGAALFAPYRSFLALYMWRIANNGPDE